MAPANYSTADAGGIICTTPACLELAADILWSLAPDYSEIDPCTDFDKLACAGFYSRNTPPAGEVYTDTSNLQVVLKNILEGPYPEGSDAGFISASLTPEQTAVDRDNFKLLTDAYNACLDYDTINEVGLKPLIRFIDRIVEAFPVEEPERLITEKDDLGKVLLLFAQYSLSTFELINVGFDLLNPDKTVLRISASNSLLTPFNGSDEIDLVASIFQEVHPANLSMGEAQKLTEDVSTLIEAMFIVGNLTIPSDPLAIAPEHTLEEVQSAAPQFGHDFIIKSLAPADWVPEDINFYPDYFSNLSVVLANTTAGTLQGFFVWAAVSQLANYIESDVTRKYRDFRRTGYGLNPNIVGKAARWARCVEFVNEGVTWISDRDAGTSGLGFMLGRFFVDRAYSQAARELTTSLMGTIQSTFIARLADRDWLSAEVKKVAEEKVNAISKKVGYPNGSPDTVDPDNLAEYYSNLEIHDDSFFDNVLATAFAFNSKTWSWLGEPSDRNIWPVAPAIFNAYYISWFNDIVILAGIEQKPLFDIDFPSYINYGGMGSILGYALTKGFDDQGHRFAPNGSLTNWFDESSEEGFENRTKCFVEQYNQFTVEGPDGDDYPVDGELTLGENIADAGGVVTSFAAWKQQRDAGATKDYDLPGLGKWTHEQLFFVKYAQSWCTVTASKAFDLALLEVDLHAPAFARIKGPLDNSAEFKRVFNCPVKEPTCELW